LRLLSAAILTLAVTACSHNQFQLNNNFRGLPKNQFNASGVSTNQFVVKLKGSKIPQALTVQGPNAPTRVVGVLAPINTLIVQTTGDIVALLARLNKDTAVAYAQPVQKVELEKTVNDPMVGKQYSLKNTNAFAGWDIQIGNKNTVVAIIDTGVDMTHPDLASKLVDTYNSLTDGKDVTDGNGHGTHCAGIAAAAADNGVGVAGVGAGLGLMSVKVLDENGGGSDASIAKGVIYAADHGAKVMSMSLGLYQRSPVLEEAVTYAITKKDVVVCASAGNNGAENDPIKAPHLPSTIAGVVEVAATAANDSTANFSNYGKTVSVAAPGVAILSTYPKNNYKELSGTSMASPFVAGLAGLVRAQFPALNQAQVKAKIEASADDLGAKGFDPRYGHGRVNVLNALR
jgi:thermitase